MESQTFKVQLNGTYFFKEGTTETFAMLIEVNAEDEQEAKKLH